MRLLTRSGRQLWIALAVALLASLWAQGPRLADPLLIEDDFRNQYWMHLFDNPNLFGRDHVVEQTIVKLPVGEHTLILHAGSPAYSLLFQAANRFMPFLLFSKLLIFPLTLAAVYFLYRIGERIKGPRAALALCLAFIVLNLASPTAVSTTAGLQRSFIFPFLLATIYFLMVGRSVAAGVVVLLSGLIYPPAFVLNAVTYGLTLLVRSDRGRWPITVGWRRGMPLFVAALGVALILVPLLIGMTQRAQSALSNGSPPEASEYARVFAPAPDGRHMLADPYFRKGNRGQIFDLFPIVGRAGLVLPGTSVVHLAILAILSLFIVLLDRRFLANVPLVLSRFFWAVWICFALAWLAIILTGRLLLYFPSRYTEAGLLLFLLIFVALNFEDAFAAGATLIARNRWILFGSLLMALVLSIALTAYLFSLRNVSGRVDPSDLRWPSLAISLFLVVLAVSAALRRDRPLTAKEGSIVPRSRALRLILFGTLFICAVVYVYAFQPRFVRPTDTELALFRYLRSLPDDSAVAISAPNKSSMPMFGTKEPVTECDRSNYDLLRGVSQAYYATTGESKTVAEFCRACDVDYLIVDERDFTADALKDAKARYANSYLERFFDSLSVDSPYLLQSVPDGARLFQAGDSYVVACDASSLADSATGMSRRR